ncbi:MAG: hypothetical protein HKN13_00785, partial [Rhodothermales bacterium]|nr:hypothetical protein [Rhodothermales bacterium]
AILDSPIGDSGVGGHVLAGLLLIEIRSLVSIPHFASLYRDPDKGPTLCPWFDAQLPNIGPSLVHPFHNLLLDDKAIISGRIAAVDVLNSLASLYPDQREKVLGGIREVVQRVGKQANIDDDELELISWAVSALVDLGDRDSAELVRAVAASPGQKSEALAELGEYAELLSDGTPSPEVSRPVPVQELYAAVRKWDEMSAEQVVEHYKEAMLSAGVDENLVTSLMSIALARFVGDEMIDSGEELVQVLKSALSSAGIAEQDLDEAVKELLVTVFAYDGLESDTVLPISLERTIRLRLDVKN